MILITNKLRGKSTSVSLAKYFSNNIDPNQVSRFASYESWQKKRAVQQPFIKKRTNFIYKSTLDHFKIDPKQFGDLSILDVGCGVGFISEEIAKLGGRVRGIDPGNNQITFAKEFAEKNPSIVKNLTYEVGTSEDELNSCFQPKLSYILRLLADA